MTRCTRVPPACWLSVAVGIAYLGMNIAHPPVYLSSIHPRDMVVLQVTAPDGVVGPVVYSMEGPEINSYNGRQEDQKFSINATTGECERRLTN